MMQKPTYHAVWAEHIRTHLDNVQDRFISGTDQNYFYVNVTLHAQSSTYNAEYPYVQVAVVV